MNLKKNYVYGGDALKILAEMPEQSFDCCITDPPYNIAANKKGLAWAFSSHVTMSESWDRFNNSEYEKFTAAWLKEVCRVTKKNGNIFIFGSFHNIYIIGAIAQTMNLKIVNSIIWAKPNAQPNITCRMFTESTEQIIWLCNNASDKATKWTFNYRQMKELNDGKQMRNFWSIPVTAPREKFHGKHPSQKPLQLMERLVLAGTNKNDLVLDCFSGSGSTLLACAMHERDFVGIEKEENYRLMSVKRLAENGGKSKDVIPEARKVQRELVRDENSQLCGIQRNTNT